MPGLSWGCVAPLTSSAFTVEDATQFLSLDVKKVSSSASWELLVATGPSFSTYIRIGFGSAQSDWTLTRSPASGYVGEQVKVADLAIHLLDAIEAGERRFTTPVAAPLHAPADPVS